MNSFYYELRSAKNLPNCMEDYYELQYTNIRRFNV